ncbi:MAG: hypothetical protein GX316_11490, partial [Firmicutes bacterium]|nr:hypothetical protein [Bacillota bacterium]
MNTKRHVFWGAVLVLVFLAFNFTTFAAPNITVKQYLPNEIYLNNADGHEFSVTVKNDEDASDAHDLGITIKIPKGFQYNEGSLEVDGPEGLDGGLIVTIDAEGDTIQVNFQVGSDEGNGDGEVTKKAFVLSPGMELELTYKLATTAKIKDVEDNPVIKATAHYKDTDGGGHTRESEEALYPLIKPGILDVLLVPHAPIPFAAHRGADVQVKAIVRNIGEGHLFGTKLKLDLGKGFEFVGLEKYAQDYIDPKEFNYHDIVVDQPLEGNTEFEFVAALKVVGYEEFDLVFTGENASGDAESILPFTFIPRQPFISMSANDVMIDYGSDGAQLVLAIKNEGGHGPARDFTLKAVGLEEDWVVENGLGKGWSRTGDIFTYNPEDEEGICEREVVTLEFNIRPSCREQLNGVSGRILFYPEYKNDEDDEFFAPITQVNYNMVNVPSLDLSGRVEKEIPSTHNDFRIFLNEKIDLIYTVDLKQIEKWIDQDQKSIVFEVELPSKLVFGETQSAATYEKYVSAGSNENQSKQFGQVKVSGEPTKLTWSMTPAEAAEKPTIVISTKATSAAASAGSDFSVNAKVQGKTICGDQGLSSQEDFRFFLQSRAEPAEVLFKYQSKDLFVKNGDGGIRDLGRGESYNVGFEKGDSGNPSKSQTIVYQLHYEFDKDSAGTWSDSSITEDLSDGKVVQQYVEGSLKYRMGDTGSWENVPKENGNITARDNKLKFDLDFLGAGVAGKSVYFRYEARVVEHALEPNAAATKEFLSRTTLKLANASGGVDENSHSTFYQGVFVPYSRASIGMSLGFADSVTTGQKLPVTLKVFRNNSPKWPIENLKITVDLGKGYHYIGNPESSGGFGGLEDLPVVEVPENGNSGDNEVVFDFTNATFESGFGEIIFDVVKTCKDAPENYKVSASLTAKDAAADELKASAEHSPTLKLKGQLAISAPNPVVISQKETEWELVVTNRGDGAAHNVELGIEVGEILSVIGYRVDGSTGLIEPETSSFTVDLDEIKAGKSKSVFVTTTPSGISSNFDETGDVTATVEHGWKTKDNEFRACETVEYQLPFRERESFVFAKNSAEAIPLGGTGIITIELTNNGGVDAYDLTVVQDLRNSGLRYVENSATLKIGGSDPTGISDGLLTIEDDKILTWASVIKELKVDQKADLSFEVYASELFDRNQAISAEVQWKRPSQIGRHSDKDGPLFDQYAGAVFWVPILRPEVYVNVTGHSKYNDEDEFLPKVYGEKEQTVEWQIEIRNDGPAAATNVLLTNQLPENMSFRSIEKMGDEEEDSGLENFVENKSWKIGTVSAKKTVVYLITTSIDKAQKELAVNKASVSWGDQDTYGETRLTSPGRPEGEATLVTHPELSNLTHSFNELTTKSGKVIIEFEVEKPLPVHNATLQHSFAQVDGIGRFKIAEETMEFKKDGGRIEEGRE